MNEQEKKKWMVCVCCPTFNHASYIVDAMNGFTMQETNFPFICGIIDDASTDGEQEVIKKYLNENFDLEDKNVVLHEETDDYVLTFARHKSNLNCYFAVFYLKYNHYRKKDKSPYFARWCDNAKYIALCEGDDFWVHSEKLQKEVDFLETHPEVGLIYTDVNRYFQDENRIELSYFKSKISVKNNHEDFILNSWWLAVCTWLYRSELERILPKLDNKKYFTGDTLKVLTFSKYGAVSFYNEVTAVYRILNKSASHFLDYEAYLAFWRKNANTRTYFARELSLRFRLKYWNKIVHEERPSFKRHLNLIPTWFGFCVRTLFALLIKR